MDTIYKQLIDELNKNGYAKTLTIISDNENIGRKVILHSDSSMDSIDYVSRNIENIVNSSVNISLCFLYPLCKISSRGLHISNSSIPTI